MPKESICLQKLLYSLTPENGMGKTSAGCRLENISKCQVIGKSGVIVDVGWVILTRKLHILQVVLGDEARMTEE